VDYDCPDRAGDWVERHYPQVRVVRSGPRARFEAARARNLGAQAAQAPWLCFIDADTLVQPEFTRTLVPTLATGGYYLVADSDASLIGLCICARQDFTDVGGYDGVLQGWGMEDKDLYFRLSDAGLEQRRFSPDLASSIPHGDEMRVQHYDIKRRKLSSTLNFVYCRAKWDLARLGAVEQMRDEAKREALYQQIAAAIQTAVKRGTSVRIELPMSSYPTFSGMVLSGTVVYELAPPASSTPRVNPRP
jgi:glycosyltransferase involved in cell wall biosynthesis